MAEHFTHTFDDTLPTTVHEQRSGYFEGKPPLNEVVVEAHGAIATIEVFQALPERNQRLVLDMAGFAMKQANGMRDRWRKNFWGLYVVGSRARGEAQPGSDLDLLSAGTFYRAQGFSDWHDNGVFEGFELETPEELPSEYNVGDVDRKYLVRATPTTEGVLPVDLNVVDLTFCEETTLDSFRRTMDVAEDGSQLPRVPLFELAVP